MNISLENMKTILNGLKTTLNSIKMKLNDKVDKKDFNNIKTTLKGLKTTVNNIKTKLNNKVDIEEFNGVQIALNNKVDKQDFKFKTINENSLLGFGNINIQTIGQLTTSQGEIFNAGNSAGKFAHAEGDRTNADGESSHAEGYGTTASGKGSHAEGGGTKATGQCSHAEGESTIASQYYSHAEGYRTTASQYYSHAEGYLTTASGSASHAEGYNTTAEGYHSHAEGDNTIASGQHSHAEGRFTTASNTCSHAEGESTIASGEHSHVEGFKTTADGQYSHAEGWNTTASNTCSHAQGHCNADMITGGSAYNKTGTAFVIGNGSISNLSNAFSVQFNGTTAAAGTITASTTADYAENFEWLDGNPEDEDRVGYFVTLDGDKIKIADSTSDYILGIISGAPFVLGNGDCDVWNGMYLRDKYNRLLTEPAPKVEEVKNEETGEIHFEEVEGEFEGTRWVVNPDYDNTQPYIPRRDRKEWDAVGMLGVLTVRQDGTLKKNGFAAVADGGIATSSKTGYRVIEIIDAETARVIFK